MEKLYVIGMGPGPAVYVLPAALTAIRDADVLAGAKRHVAPFAHLGKETIIVEGDFSGAAALIAKERLRKKIAVLVSGDPCLFSMTNMLSGRPGFEGAEIVPGISSFQLLAAKTGFMWNDAKVISLHGRDMEALAGELTHNLRLAVFLDDTNNPKEAAKAMINAGFPDMRILLGFNVGYEDEEIIETNPLELSTMNVGGGRLCVMLAEKPAVGSTA